MRTLFRALTVLVLGLAPCLARAESLPAPLPASFSLGQYVPGDWWMYMHFVHNPEREWIDQKWAEVWSELCKTGIDKDLLTLITNLLSDEQRSQTEATVAKVRELLAGVRWGDLVAREVVFAERIAPPIPDYAVLLRGSEGSAEHNVRGLAAILEYFASFTDKIKVERIDKDKIESWVLRIEKVPYSVHLFRKGDVIGVVTNESTFNTVTTLMAGGKDAKPPITESPRFIEAMRQVKKPENGVLFFDFKLLFADLNSFMDFACAKAGTNEDELQGLEIIKKLMGTFDFIDYHVISMETEGRRDFSHMASVVRADKMDSPCATICHSRKPFEKFDKYIPAEATGFTVDTFFDMGLTYRLVLEFVALNVPGGKEGIVEWNQMLAGVGFDPDRDLFSWWSGEMIDVQLPPSVVTAFGSNPDWVLMIRVKDSELAAQKVNTGVQWVKALVAQSFPDQQVSINALDVGGGGFQEIVHPLMAMMFRPAFGVKDEWLFIASSGTAITKCLDVAAGKAPSVMKNERFASEGIIPKGPVMAASFADTSKTAQEMAAGLGMASMIGGLIGAQIPAPASDPDAKKGKELVQKLFGILGKLTPVVAKIDFYSSESSVTYHDGPISRTQSVVTYKASEKEGKTAQAK